MKIEIKKIVTIFAVFSLALALQATAVYASSSQQAGLTGISQDPLRYSSKEQLLFSSRDKQGRAVNAHIQLKNSDEPKIKRAASLTFNPVGWHNYNFYFKENNGSIGRNWLMNRGHLVGYQFCGKNDEARNLVPETAYLNSGSLSGMDADNQSSMLYFEEHLDSWLAQHQSDRLDYQVTPLYKGSELIPRQIRLAYLGYNHRGQKIKIRFNSSLEDNSRSGATVVYLSNNSANATINYANGNAANTVKKVSAKPQIKTFLYGGATLTSNKISSYTIEVVKSNNAFVGYAKANQIVYVTGNGVSKVYWFSKDHLPKNTNMRAIKNFTIQNAVLAHKKLSQRQVK